MQFSIPFIYFYFIVFYFISFFTFPLSKKKKRVIQSFFFFFKRKKDYKFNRKQNRKPTQYVFG